MKVLVCLFSFLVVISSHATELPTCTLKATVQNELPYDVTAEVVKVRSNYFLQFAKEKIPVRLDTQTDRSVIENVLGFMGRKVPRGTQSIDSYEYATSGNHVILYVVRSSTGKTLAKFLLIDGAGGACAK